MVPDHPPIEPRSGTAPDELLDGLDPAQRAVVTCDHAPLAIVAGPGSGKTRVLTRRIAWRIATGATAPSHVLAVTFTRKAAAELVQRLGALPGAGPALRGGTGGVTAGTLHSVALAQLRRRAERRDRPMPALLDRKVGLLLGIIRGTGADARVTAAEVASEIEWAKARLLTPEHYGAGAAAAGRAPGLGIDATAEAYSRYERERRRRRLVDFDDLLWWCGDALQDDEEFGAEQRFRFRHLYVDEFQDVSPAQLRVVRGWLGERTDLTVVGDPDQAIFSFTGADAGGLTRFAQEFAGARVLRLDCNYRSTRQVVAVADALLADGRSGQRGRPARATPRGDGAAPRVTVYDDGDDEATGVAARLLDGHDPAHPWSQCAVLYRTNAQSVAFEAALAAAGIPYRVRGDGRFLDRPEVRAALDVLRASERRAPGTSLEQHLHDLEESDTATSGARGEHAVAVARLAREYLDLDPGGSVDGLCAWLATTLRTESPTVGGDAVELLTFHRAKGLEFRRVFVTGLERGLVPIARADTPAARAEERRLLYVALTRAEDHLELSWARRRALGSRTVGRAPSPWLAPIEAAAGSGVPGDARRAATARASLDEARDRLASVTPDDAPDRALLAALVEWRRGQARAASIPAFVIFHDSTLRAIASTLPTTRAALLEVPGIGPVKAERYAEPVLALVRAHAERPVVTSA